MNRTCFLFGHAWAPHYIRVWTEPGAPWAKVCMRCGEWKAAPNKGILCRLGLHQWVEVTSPFTYKDSKVMQCQKCGIILGNGGT